MSSSRLYLTLNLLQEALRAAVANFRGHLLRTILSLLGVSVGVFCIIGILTMVDSLEANIRSSLSDKLGSSVVYVQRFPWTFSRDYPWWKYVNRPRPNRLEKKYLERRAPDGMVASFCIWTGGKTLERGSYRVEDAKVTVTDGNYLDIFGAGLKSGRFFSPTEVNRGIPVTVLGHSLAEGLFPRGGAVGRSIRLMGQKVSVIGVFEPEGASLLSGNNIDEQALVTAEWMGLRYQLDQLNGGRAIVCKGPPEMPLATFKAELEGAMRRIRKTAPQETSNFALNEISLVNNTLGNIFQAISAVGAIIAFFSILVGGFSIANILFVSVKERTPLIGIQKALGAPRFYIQAQFLLEAVLLCVSGGVLGLILIAALGLTVTLASPFTIFLSLSNILTGLSIAAFTGLLAGWIPSRQASRLDPIEAIRYTSA